MHLLSAVPTHNLNNHEKEIPHKPLNDGTHRIVVLRQGCVGVSGGRGASNKHWYNPEPDN